jgi:RNA polymerase sigma-70 factor (ECF subfamily)
VFREVPRFDRQREGSFRAWLRQVTVNKIRNYRRKRYRRAAVALDPADGFLKRLSDPKDDLAGEWHWDHHKHAVEQLLALVRPDFTPATWVPGSNSRLSGNSSAALRVFRSISVGNGKLSSRTHARER